MQSLINGQNLPWPGQVVRIEVYAAAQCDVSVLLLGADEKVRSSDDLVFYNQPSAPGVQWAAGPPQTVIATLAEVPTERLICVLSVDPDQPTMGRSPAPILRLLVETGEAVAEFVPAALTSERAIIACEVYRRAGVWKVRAVGQGYSGGLSELIRAHGVEVSDAPAPAPPQPTHAAPAQPQSLPVNQPRANPQQDDRRAALEQQHRLFGQCSAIMEDASRSTASLQSTRGFAESKLHSALESQLDDPRLRVGGAADEARQRAQLEHDDLVGQAHQRHRQDMAQLTSELAGFEAELPAPMARWSHQTWQQWQPPQYPGAGFRIGELTLDDAPDLAVPMLVVSPLRRPLWIDPTTGGPANAALMLRAVLTRMLACYPAGQVVVHAVDPAGRPDPLAPIGGPNCQVQTSPAAVTLEAVRALLIELTAHVDRVQMAFEAGMPDEVDARDRIVVIHDFPTGLDDGCLALLRNLLDVGPRLGVQFVVTGMEDPSAGPVAAGLFRLFNHLPAGDGGSLRDGYGDIEWTFVPDLGPDQHVVDQLLIRISRGAS